MVRPLLGGEPCAHEPQEKVLSCPRARREIGQEAPTEQPPDLADVLLHETANAWLAHRLDRSALQLAEPWKESPHDFERRLQACVRDLNSTCDVRGLCMDFPERLRELGRRGGDRLKH